MSEPASLEESLGWPEFCDWYALRHQEMAELEREFGNFVEDEREREGRLFRRWCTLTLTDWERRKSLLACLEKVTVVTPQTY